MVVEDVNGERPRVSNSVVLLSEVVKAENHSILQLRLPQTAVVSFEILVEEG